MLGWFSPGDLDPDFEAAVDTLRVGELSKPVRSRYGFHLIEVLDRRLNSADPAVWEIIASLRRRIPREQDTRIPRSAIGPARIHRELTRRTPVRHARWPISNHEEVASLPPRRGGCDPW